MTDTRADTIKEEFDHVAALCDTRFAESVPAITARFDAALDGLLADAAEQRESLKREKRASDVESEMLTLRYQAAEARIVALETDLAGVVSLAQHLWAMIPQEVWRAGGGDDGQGHYEGDYHAENVRERLAALAASAPAEEQT